jgi:hypothetical protein
MNKDMSRLEVVFALVLLLIIFKQIHINWVGYVSNWGRDIMRLSELPARDRAGILSVEYGPEDIRYFQFIRSQTPEDATILVPPEDQGQFGNYRFRYLLEYYFFPATDCAMW